MNLIEKISKKDETIIPNRIQGGSLLGNQKSSISNKSSLSSGEKSYLIPALFLVGTTIIYGISSYISSRPEINLFKKSSYEYRATNSQEEYENTGLQKITQQDSFYNMSYEESNRLDKMHEKYRNEVREYENEEQEKFEIVYKIKK